MKQVTNTTMKLPNFAKARGLNYRHFISLPQYMDAEHTGA
jgi:hypothetical protein